MKRAAWLAEEAHHEDHPCDPKGADDVPGRVAWSRWAIFASGSP